MSFPSLGYPFLESNRMRHLAASEIHSRRDIFPESRGFAWADSSEEANGNAIVYPYLQ